MKHAIIDGTVIRSMEDLHCLLAEQLSFPDWYGKNLDALHDCLTDLHEETQIAVLHAELLEETLDSSYMRLCRVLADSAEENPYLTITF